MSDTPPVEGSDQPTGAASMAKWIRFSPLDILKIVSGAVVLTGLVLHLIGTASHDAYLSEWGVETALFPKPVDRVMIQGYSWLLVSGFTLWRVVLENVWELTLFSAGTVLYFAVLNSLSKRIYQSTPPRWLLRVRPELLRPFAMFLLVLLSLVFVVLATWLLTVTLAQPLLLAVNQGKEQARKERARAVLGCKTEGGPRCFELRRGSDVIGRGILIDSSTQHIAYFDVASSSVRVLPRQDLEVVLRMR